MRMAAGAVQSEAHYGRPQNLDLVGHKLQAVRDKICDAGKRAVGCSSQETSRDQIVKNLLGDRRGIAVVTQLIACDLLKQETPVALVLVERTNHVVAIAKHILANSILILRPL